MMFRFFPAKLKADAQNEFTRYLCSVLLVIVLATPTFAQGFRFGVKVGVPMTEYFDTISSRYSSATRRYTVGPSVEVHVWKDVGLEFDALYKRIGYVGIASRFTRQPPFITDSFDVKGNSWDFPLMMKYRFGRVVRPYVAGGGAVRYIGPVRARGVRTINSLAPGPNNTAVSVTTTTPIDTSNPPDLRRRMFPGLTVASGIEFRRGRLRLRVEHGVPAAHVDHDGVLARIALRAPQNAPV